MAGGGGSSSTSKPVDMTPQAFKNLQQPFANVVASLLGFSPTGAQGTGTSTPTPQGGTGGTGGAGGTGGTGTGVAFHPSPAAEGGVPGQDVGITTGPSNNTAGTRGAAGTPGTPTYTGGPTPGNPNSVLSGIPAYGGQTTAGITGNESSLLSQLMGTTGLNDQAMASLNALLSGSGGYPQAGAGTVGTSQVAGTNINPADVASTFNATNNPLLQAYITASQRATMDNLAQTLVNNGSRFTANGQFIQPTGSSAFDRAQALATQSAANASSDIASNIGYNAYNLNQTLNQSTAQSNAANALQALLGNQSTGLAASTSNAANTLTASGQNASNQLTASQSNQNAALQEEQNQIAAATAQGNLSSGEVSSLVSNLQAQALPRLIEQYGLDQGLQMFNNQVNDLMTILQTGAGVTSPVVANESKSSSTQKPNLL
jgi:hypothetical protein